MVNHPRFSLLVPLTAALSLPACSGSEGDEQQSGGPDGGGNTDSGMGPGGDAQVVAPDPDSSTPEPDAGTPQGISLTLRDNTGARIADAPVLLYDQAGTKLDTLLTDQAGQIHAPLAPHAVMVLPPAENLELFRGALTYLGVEDGDDLIVEIPGERIAAELGSFTLTVPPLAGAQYYIVTTGNDLCTSFHQQAAGTTFTLPITEDCRADSMDLVVTAMSSGQPIGYAALLDQTPPAMDGNKALTYEGAWTDSTALSIATTNIASTFPYVTPYIDGQQVYTAGDVSEGAPGSFTFPYPAGIVNQFDVDLSFEVPVDEGYASTAFKQKTADTSAVSYDGSVALAPMRVTGVDLTANPPQISLIAAPEAADAAGLVVDLAFPAEGGQGTFGLSLGFILAPGTTSIEVFGLNDIAQHFAPEIDESAPPTEYHQYTWVYEGDSVPDYQAFRQEAISFEYDVEGSDLEPVRERPSFWQFVRWSMPR